MSTKITGFACQEHRDAVTRAIRILRECDERLARLERDKQADADDHEAITNLRRRVDTAIGAL